MDTPDFSGNNFNQEIETLIEEERNEEVKSILQNDHFFLSFNASKNRLLHYCAKYGNNEIAKYLLERDYYVDIQDENGDTPLTVAVKNNEIVIVAMLLAVGANILVVNKENKSTMHYFFEEQFFSPEMGELIFPAFIKLFSTYQEKAEILMRLGCQLFQAIYFKDFEVIRCMLERKIPVNSRHTTYKLTALHVAVALELVDVVHVLLEYGANIHALDHAGSTPLHYIYSYNTEHTPQKIELLRILLNLNDIPLTLCNNDGFFQVSPIMVQGNREAISLVLKSNIDIKVRDRKYGSSILHYLAANRNLGVVDELKLYARKFDMNISDNSKRSSLHVAAVKNNFDMMKFLLEEGVNPNGVHKKIGYTPLYYVYLGFEENYEKQFYQCIELLLQNNANPQFVARNKKKKLVTIFDVAKRTESIKRLKPIVAHLVLLERLGISITEISYSKINSYVSLKKYFNKCQKLVSQKICENITLFKLLTSSERKIARYSGNEELILKLERLSKKQNTKLRYMYYHNILKKLFTKGIPYRRFLDEVTGVLWKIFGERLDKGHLVFEKIVDCLDEKSLQNLYELSKNTC